MVDQNHAAAIELLFGYPAIAVGNDGLLLVLLELVITVSQLNVMQLITHDATEGDLPLFTIVFSDDRLQVPVQDLAVLTCPFIRNTQAELFDSVAQLRKRSH